ncbi:hypothetical protein CORC01_09091 [Colletotrichum orchidophilum]|uniref:Uncharacterized protein n=1 Tax=Colletotrichum orchidophilum TaxID=1209926 RepID=A0A1G4B2L3_9PEZI|nr:uncharacterized protein CORC01_09091 [Colletotrichum orchidophilum]OHE95659.1 hypothetical protein CORC01_09091 [Colletotrichum orchidophilum]
MAGKAGKAGIAANTCLKSTTRDARELQVDIGYKSIWKAEMKLKRMPLRRSVVSMESFCECTKRLLRATCFADFLRTDATASFTTAANGAVTNLVWLLIVENVMTVGDWVRASERKV